MSLKYGLNLAIEPNGKLMIITNKKKIKDRIESICRFFIILGGSAIFIYSAKQPDSIFILTITILFSIVAFIACFVSFNKRINEKLITYVWCKKSNKTR